ncbi:MAG: type III-A CRISPR-associated RAMP protein Csm3 [Lachnospiraceae bacterium]|jgi:CRISPR type III-A/MTUBE-associated RAMP protein Csm3|nr:type III-A CRISPR-associated RAMP protein Csm3 [Lachnospiraceae bacterium]
MYAKIQITGSLEVKTGMHIGGSSVFAAIGAVDSPVIKDAQTPHLPIIPGSSLKGKLRTLLAKKYNTTVGKPDDDAACLTRLFGCAKKGQVQASRLLISDMFLNNAKELKAQGLQGMTEVKFENTISRTTAVANPRQIERVIRGTLFDVDMIYEVYDGTEKRDENETIEDISLLAEGLKLIQYDYLGGHGSRGYGKIAFHDLQAETVVGTLPDGVLEKCNQILQQAAAH